MSRIDEDNVFIEEEAGWLPLEKSVVTVKECLLRFISSLAAATDYLRGKTDESPEEQMSDLFAIVCNNKCRAFEELCDRVKECNPGSIPDGKVESIWQLGKILASRAEKVLPDDDVSCNDLRNAMTSLFTLASNTPSKTPVESYEAKVEETRKEIHLGFKSLSNGFRKLERQRERGEDESPTEADKIISCIEGAKEEMHGEAAGIRHEIERIRKGGKATKRWGVEEQLGAAKVWKANKNNPLIKQQMDHDGRIQKPDVFTHCKKELAGFRVESPEEFIQILEQHRGRQKAAKTRRRAK